MACADNTPPNLTNHNGSSAQEAAGSLRLIDGDCWVFFAFDVGNAIDLDAAQVQLAALEPNSARREEIPRSPARHAPDWFKYQPSPLRIDEAAPELKEIVLGGFRPALTVECTLFDFGAVSVAYRIPLEGGTEGVSLASLVGLAQVLFDCAPLRDDATKRATALATRLEDTIDRMSVASIAEDYTVYHARRWSSGSGAGVSAAEAVSAAGEALARVLLAEAGSDRLSPQAVESVLSAQISYSLADVAVIDWNAALVLGKDEEDTLAVLEFANIELLEMRFLDDQLDAVLDRSHTKLLRRDAKGNLKTSPLGFIFDPHRAERRRLAALQMESAVLFEGVNNALKLVGDQHLARLYAAAMKRFHLADWDRSILRKLHTVEGMYQKLADDQATRRMEVLEWIIILLFVIDIVLPFVGVEK